MFGGASRKNCGGDGDGLTRALCALIRDGSHPELPSRQTCPNCPVWRALGAGDGCGGTEEVVGVGGLPDPGTESGAAQGLECQGRPGCGGGARGIAACAVAGLPPLRRHADRAQRQRPEHATAITSNALHIQPVAWARPNIGLARSKRRPAIFSSYQPRLFVNPSPSPAQFLRLAPPNLFAVPRQHHSVVHPGSSNKRFRSRQARSNLIR